MSQFSFQDYQKVVERAQNPSNNAVKIGFFKLPKDGDEALVRINLKDINDLEFANVHKPAFGKKFEGLGTGYTPVSCLNEVGSYSDNCPFCKAVAAGNDTIGKASKVVYIKMLVAYKDAATGQFSAAIPVVWERPAGFSKELASKFKNYGPLAERVFKITRNGSGKDTKYSLDYIPMLDKPELVPTDFSAFNNFDLSKHSFWVKSVEDLQYFLDNGAFKQPENANKSDNLTTREDGSKVGGAPVFDSPAEEKAVEAALNMQPEQPAPAPAQAPVKEEAPAPKREINRGNFSF